MREVAIISGSPSLSSRSDRVLKYLGELLEREHFTIKHISIREIPSNDLFQGNYDSPSVQQVAKTLNEASGVIVGSPVYKAAYSGVLKSLFDILPQDILQHKPVLPLMTGGSPSHMLALEYTMKPLLATLKGQTLKGIYMLDCQIDKQKYNPIVDEDIWNRTKKQLSYFIEILKKQEATTVITDL
ncbi:NADPH-dependent FMN reductase [Virgibacillus halodenitrificans]|uniref:NADPH-dependent FMN reductase n=1 Tax=Virgibacillus halodenitrificans TaxID=1482 RepID=UPI0024C06A38|nr:NADPH-dependent FMN reductase [Virgibacillus halodenitrificans]WHX26496.1 NADPH-dependent FMN reductase [Virgibacillus halodenitrificans]